MNAKTIQMQLVAIRVGLGAGAIVAPRVMGRVFGVDPSANPVSPYLMRLFGIRELYMAWTLFSATEAELEQAATNMIPIDSADAVASTIAGIAGYLPRQTALMSTTAALFGAVHGVLLREKSRDEQVALTTTQ